MAAAPDNGISRGRPARLRWGRFLCSAACSRRSSSVVPRSPRASGPARPTGEVMVRGWGSRPRRRSRRRSPRSTAVRVKSGVRLRGRFRRTRRRHRRRRAGRRSAPCRRRTGRPAALGARVCGPGGAARRTRPVAGASSSRGSSRCARPRRLPRRSSRPRLVLQWQQHAQQLGRRARRRADGGAQRRRRAWLSWRRRSRTSERAGAGACGRATRPCRAARIRSGRSRILESGSRRLGGVAR